MPTTAGEAIMTQIANAIRSKSPAPFNVGAIHVRDFSQRIKRIPRADDVRKLFVYPTERTATQMTTDRLVRLDGRPAFESPSLAIHDAFKRADWQANDFPSPDSFPARNYTVLEAVGDKIYLGTSTVGTTIVVINTVSGKWDQITGLPSRPYNGFYLRANRYLYCFPTSGSTSINTIVRIDTTTDVFITIALNPTTSRVYNTAVAHGQRLFFGWASGNAAEIPFIDMGPEPPTAGNVSGLPSRPHSNFFSVGSKLFDGSADAATEIAVISAAGTAPNYSGALTVASGAAAITGLPSRIYNIWFPAGNFLYVGSTTSATSILRIDHTNANNTRVLVGGTASTDPLPRTALPDRIWRTFAFVSNKVYVVGNTAGTSAVVITNATGVHSQIQDLPSRAYLRIQVVGTKIYLGHNGSHTTLVGINSSNDTFFEIVGLTAAHTDMGMWFGTGWGSSGFDVDGTDLYMFPTASFNTSMSVINTINDTRRARLSGFSDSANVIRLIVPPHPRANVMGGIYTGQVGDTSSIHEIDFETVRSSPSDASITVRRISTAAHRAHSVFAFGGGKIWITGTVNGNNASRVTMLTKSTLPNIGAPPFGYIKY